MKLLNNPKGVEFLQEEFEQFKFELYSTYLKGNLFLSCIVCWSNSVDDTINLWREVQSIISVNYQPQVEYARWNIYLVFLNQDKLAIDDKYKIENDKYSVRKIVLDGLSNLPSISEVEGIINTELLGADMKLSEDINKYEDISGLIESDIFDLIKDLPLGNTKEEKIKRSHVLDELVKVLN